MAYPATVPLEAVSRRCLSNLVDYLWELEFPEPPPTEAEWEEMLAMLPPLKVGWDWDDQHRAEREEERFQQEEYEAREREESRKRKREEELIAKRHAEAAQQNIEWQERKGMHANDERELKRQAEWAAACEFLQSL